jgi:hypothetical protein
VAKPAIEAAREKMRAAAQLENLGVSLPWPSEEMWRQTVQTYREKLYGDDVDAAREALRDLVGPIKCGPAEDGVVLELVARNILLATGACGSIGRWDGSGGVLLIHLPVSTRR